MATYLNPESLLPKNDFVASGPLGGALAGLQTMYGIGGLEAGQRDQDLGYLEQLNKYENTLKDNPIKDLEREVASKDMSSLIDLYGQGIPQEARKAGYETTISNSNILKQKQRAQELLDKAELVNQANAAMEEAKGGGPAALDSAWGEWGGKLRAAGVRVPAGAWDESARQALKINWAAAKERLPEYKAIIKKEAEIAAREEASRKQLEQKHKYTIEAIRERGKNAKELAEINNTARAERANGSMNAEEAAVAEIRTGKPDPIKMERYVAIMASKFRQGVGDRIRDALDAASSAGGTVPESLIARELGKGMPDSLYRDLAKTNVFKAVAEKVTQEGVVPEDMTPSKKPTTLTPTPEKPATITPKTTSSGPIGVGTIDFSEEKAPNGLTHKENMDRLRKANPNATQKQLEESYLEKLKEWGLSTRSSKNTK